MLIGSPSGVQLRGYDSSAIKKAIIDYDHHRNSSGHKHARPKMVISLDSDHMQTILSSRGDLVSDPHSTKNSDRIRTFSRAKQRMLNFKAR